MPQKRTIKAYIHELRPYLEAAASQHGKPQGLTVVAGKLYWTQGKSQELFCLPLNDVKGVPQRVITESPQRTAKAPLTKEEELLRERTRRVVTGVTSFRVRPSDHAVFYVVGLDLFVFYTQGERAGQPPLNVFHYLTEADKRHFAERGNQPHMSIQHVQAVRGGGGGGGGGGGAADLTTITFVNGNNVYLGHIHEHPASATTPLSVKVEAITTVGTEKHQCGVADYITQEEFDRYVGHYASDAYVVFSYTDLTMMRDVALPRHCRDPTKEAEELEHMAYSRVGDPNTRTTILVYERATRILRVVPPESIASAVPWHTEYIPRFGFKDANTVWFSSLSRTQEEMAVLSCPIAQLPTIAEEDLPLLYREEEKEAKVEGRVLYTEPAPQLTTEWVQQVPWAWVEVVPGPPILFGALFDILLSHATSTTTAHYHLSIRKAGDDGSSWRPLTAGPWNVKPGSVKVHGNRVFFLANADGRLKQVLYSVPLPTGEEGAETTVYTSEQLTRHSQLDEHVYQYCCGTGSSSSTEDTAAPLFFTASTRTSPTQLFSTAVAAADTDEAVSSRVALQLVPWMNTEVPSASGDAVAMVTPTVVTTRSRRGVPLSASVFVSPHAAAATPGPLVLFVYGGPHVQLVYENDYDGGCRDVVQVLLRNGISVAVVDNQMSNANGLRDLSICKKNMGRFETDDYVDVVSFLCDADAVKAAGLPVNFSIDPCRVGIYGWSYGGYATLLAMCQAAEVFKMGFAGAPVGDWKLYDTGYTERYMGLLYDSDSSEMEADTSCLSAAYMDSTIAHFVDGFPDDLNRVFIAHGLLDENVHFGHTCAVVHALIQAGKPFSTVVYPGERHGLRQDRQSRLHHNALLLKTFVELL